MRAPLITALAGLALLGGCGPAEPVPMCPVSLVDHYRWTLVPESGATGDKGPCTRDDVTAELFADGTPSFSVETRRCSAATVEQPLLRKVPAGAAIHVRISHYALTSTASGDGLVSVSVDGAEVFSEPVALPSAAAAIEADPVVPAGAAVGAPIRWHVQNHGDNSWNLVDLTVHDVCPGAE